MVLATTAGLIRDAVHVLMEGVPRAVEYKELRRDLRAIEGVTSVHSLHIWSLTLDRAALSVHLAISKSSIKSEYLLISIRLFLSIIDIRKCLLKLLVASADAEQILKRATRLLQTKHKIAHCTVQVERFNAAMETCPQCTALSD